MLELLFPFFWPFPWIFRGLFAYNVMAAIFLNQCKEVSAILGDQHIPWGTGLKFRANISSSFRKSIWWLVAWVKIIYSFDIILISQCRDNHTMTVRSDRFLSQPITDDWEKPVICRLRFHPHVFVFVSTDKDFMSRRSIPSRWHSCELRTPLSKSLIFESIILFKLYELTPSVQSCFTRRGFLSLEIYVKWIGEGQGWLMTRWTIAKTSNCILRKMIW